MEVFPLNLQPGRLGIFLQVQDLTARGNLQNLSQFPAFGAVSTAACFNPTGSFLQLITYTPSAIKA